MLKGKVGEDKRDKINFQIPIFNFQKIRYNKNMIYLACDHRGFELKEKIKKWLGEWGYEHTDLGNTVYDKEDDYPDFAIKLAKNIKYQISIIKNKEKILNHVGIVICGSGIGVSVAANRFSGIRCALGFDADQVQHGVENDHINVLALPADYLSEEKAKELVKIFLTSKPVNEERFVRRIKKLEKIQ